MGHGTEVLVARRALRRVGLAATLTFAVLAALAGPGNAYVYWTNNGPGTGSTGTTIGRANNDGQGLKSVLINNAAAPGGIIIHGKYIYWANTTTGAIGRASLSGGGVNQHFLSPGEPVDYLAISGPYIYWTSSGNYIGRANLNGSQIQLQCINAGTTPDGIAAVGGMIYLSGFAEIDRALAQCGAAPSTFVTLKTPQSNALGLAVADGYLYWAQVNFASPAPGSTIGRASLSAPAQADESFVPSLYFPSTVAVSGGYLYWVDHTGSSGNGAIGREQLVSQIRNYSFIKDSNGPIGIAADTSIDPTSTTVTCSPTRVAKSNPTVCTAVVHDSASSELPTGTVLFHGSAGVFFPGGNSCTLTKRPTGGAGCTVGAESAASGKHSVVGVYKGNPTHHASTGSTTFCAGSKTVCKHA